MLRTPVRPLFAAALLLASATVALAAPPPTETAVQIIHIPFADWLAAQSNTVMGWLATESSKPFAPAANLGVVDYAGKLATQWGLSYGLTTSGTVSVRKQPDGTGIVQVNMNFDNAINYARDKDAVAIFGYRASELSAGGGTLTPALAQGHLQAKYVVPDADSPELDLVVAFNSDGVTPVQLKFHSVGKGPCRAGLGVPEGTPGICLISEANLVKKNAGANQGDGWPVEHVDVRPLGHGATTESYTSETGFEPEGTDKVVQRTPTTWGRVKALYR